MTTDEILFVIKRHIQSSKTKGASTALENLKKEIEEQIQKEQDELKKPTGRCDICRKTGGRLHQGKYCMQCFDLYID